MTSDKRDKNCKRCGKECFGTLCRECFVKNKGSRVSKWSNNLRKRKTYNYFVEE